MILQSVHVSTKPRSPLRHRERERAVGSDRAHREKRKLRSAPRTEDVRHQPDLDRGGHHVEYHAVEDKLDPSRAALDGSSHRPGLSAEVKAQVQLVQVVEALERDAADGRLRHLGERGVLHFFAEGGARA